MTRHSKANHKAAGAEGIATTLLVFALQRVAVGDYPTAIVAGGMAAGGYVLAERFRTLRLPEGVDTATIVDAVEDLTGADGESD